ncbi:chromate transporter [Neoroseomonas oryzicola]|uniref:Chromate transporter n=1 Tax=Neoroseomonas oryzicola TaxID=535904 RepID=A0A9X9WE32_9PROT|nr:chromate transporter [Neoroseomonas oryzicola]MBR0658592.1 chromate transporter [Neoroseomonas oryzicola]NKE16623.1 chromate transporter [Neoroseomonas oryzicola]
MTATVFWQLVLGFGAISLVSVGGGIAVLPEMHRLVVEVHGWMSDADFARRFALAQAAPGPNVLVVGLFGWHVGGIGGMLTAVLAMTLPTSLMAFGFSRLRARLAGKMWLRIAERGLVPIAVGLIAASGLILARGSATGWIPALVTAGSTLFVWRTDYSPLWILAGGAVVGALLL